jgi:hypothetical protein
MQSKRRRFEDFAEIQAVSQEVTDQHHETRVLAAVSTAGETPEPVCKPCKWKIPKCNKDNPEVVVLFQLGRFWLPFRSSK